MKKIIVLAMSVLFSTLVFANGTDEPTGSSSVMVLNSVGSKLFKVLYKARKQGDVKVSIFNDKDDVVFSETLKQREGFIRPYNFEGLPEGAYTIQVEDAGGKQLEKINYGTAEVQPFIHLTKLPGESDKYLLTGHFQNENRIQVRIYNASNELVFDESRTVSGQFGEVYNLKNLPGCFKVEVEDRNGVLKSIQF